MPWTRSTATRLVRAVTASFRGGGYSARDVWSLVHPVILDTLFLTIVQFANTGIISSNGPAAISAVSTSESVYWFMVGTFTSIALGATVLVAQHDGAGDRSGVGHAVVAAMHASVLTAVVYAGAVLAFLPQIIQILFGAAEPLVADGIRIYLTGLLISFPVRALYLSISGALRGIGRTRETLVLSVLDNGSNLLLNIVLVLGLDMGIEGLAVSAVLSQFIGAGAGLAVLLRSRERLGLTGLWWTRVEWSWVARMTAVSVPFILEDMFFNGGKLIIQTFIVPFGTLQVAANAIISTWIHIPEVIPRSLGIAIVPIVGACVSRGDFAYARKISRTFTITGSVAALVVFAVTTPLYPWALDHYFHAPAEIHPVLWQLLVINLIGYPLAFTAQSVLPSTLRAAGDGPYATGASLASMWIYRIGLGYLVSVVLGYQVVGLWLVWVTEWGVRWALFHARMRGTAWTRHALT